MNSIYTLSNTLAEIRRSLRLAFPLIASEIIYALNAFIATIMIAHLGRDQLAANALCWGVYIAVSVFFMGIYSGVGIMGAQNFGAKDQASIVICFKQGLILASGLSIPMMLVMWLSPFVLTLTGQDPVVIYYAKPFFHSLIWCMFPFSFLFVIQQFLICIGETRMVMWMSIIQVPIQVLFYYVFLFGKFGFLNLGLAGIGYGLTVSFSIVAIVFCVYLFHAKRFEQYRLFSKWWLINSKFLFEMIRIGLPLGLLYCIEVAFFAAVAFMMGRLGTNVLVAYQISYQFLMIGVTFMFAMMQTVGIRVGHEVGRNNKNALKLATFVNMGITMSGMLLFLIVFIAFPNAIISIDIDVHSKTLLPVVKMATGFLLLAGIFLISESIRGISLSALRSMKDTKFPVFASIIGFWCIAFPGAYLFAFKYHFGGNGIWFGIITGLFTTGIMLFIRFNHSIKKIELSRLVTRGGVV